LRDALSGENKIDLDVKLNRLEKPRRLDDVQEGSTREQRAGEAEKALSKVSKAFDESEPKATQMARKSDSLKPDQQESFNQGMSQLGSLIKRLEEQRPTSRPDQNSQGQEALYNLQNGMRSLYGDNDRGNQLMLKLDKMLKGEAPPELEDLKKLMDELQHFSVETADRFAKKEDKPEVTNIDPTRLPPAYRGRIQKYFQKLSEK